MKGRILYWGDAPTSCTGFGVVARHVLGALHGAGYEIDCLALNAVSDFHDRQEMPYAIAPANLIAQDPYGYRMLLRALGRRRYDLLFVQNDLHITHPAAAYLRKLRDRGSPPPPILYYYPVDCRVQRHLTGMLELADRIATCTNFGRLETEKTLGTTRSPLVIPHGVDTGAFRPLPDRAAVRARVRARLGLPEECFLVCSVAVNSVRKDLARAIAAFARFRTGRSGPSAFYIHTNPLDGGLDLNEAVAASGLTAGKDILFPAAYHPLQGVPDETLNELYNAADLYFTTTLGEGWGLPITEAMASGLPVVAPRNSSLAEIAGDGRAILYECREHIWVDNSGYRPLGLMDDIVAALSRAATLSRDESARMTAAARAFVARLEWPLVTPRFVEVADELVAAARAKAGGDATT